MRLLLMLSLFCLCSCEGNNEADKMADESYDKFKDEISKDSMSVFARGDAENVVKLGSDSGKIREAAAWIDKYDQYMKAIDQQDQEKKKANSNFLSKAFTIKKVLRTDPGCNRLSADYLITPNTVDKDSLLKAMEIFTDSVFATIPYKEGCSPLKCILALYTSEKEFDLNTWLVLGKRMAGQKAEVEYSLWK